MFLALLLGGVAMFRFMPEKYVQGTVIDFQTSVPVADVLIALHQTGSGFIDGGLVWDKQYVYETTSDQNGRFKIAYKAGSSAHVIATKDGYIDYEEWHANGSDITIKLKQTIANYQPLPNGSFTIGIENHRPFGWNFSRNRTTFNRDEADIFPEFEGEPNTERVTIQSGGAGGIAYISNDAAGISGDPLIFSDTAPADGYQPSAPLVHSDQKGIYFVRTNDGGHYAKFASSYITIGSEQEFKQGNWALQFAYVFNPDGSRNLEFQK